MWIFYPIAGDEMNLQSTTDFIYKNCSDRISQRIKKKKLSHRSIYKYEPKMIGRICRCIVVPKRNPYLIQDSVRDELKEKLEFKSYQDMLWGTEKEIREYLPVLFLMIMSDLANDKQYREITNRILCAYIPYARYYGYYRIVFEYDPLLPDFDNSYFYELDSSELLSSIDNSFSEAVNHLYEKCKYQFLDAYMDFITNHDSFKRWTYRFEEWIEASLLPLIKQYMPEDSSFSTRILNMIESDFSKIPLLKITNDPDELEVIRSLLASTDKYIDSLEEIYRNHPYIDFNKW